MLRYLSRIITGLLFLFSGAVKAVDPVGGAIKLKDYFDAFGMEFFNDIALPLSILLSSVEFILGFHLLINIRIKHIASTVFSLMLFFTALTLVLAIYNPVSDCGCFGDAIVISNWQTFIKNLITLPLAWIIFRYRNQQEELLTGWRINSLSLLSVIFAVGISIYSYQNLPVMDFRPFKTGTNIPEGMKIPEDALQPEYKTIFILEKDGMEKEFNENNYPYSDTTWVFIDSKTELIKEGFQPPITDFYITTKHGKEATYMILNSEKPVFLMIAPEISKIKPKQVTELIKLSNKCRLDDIRFYCVTNSLDDEIRKFELKNRALFHYLFADEVLLETIIRGNPGLVVLYKGTILAKYNYLNTPSLKIVENPVSYILQEKNRQTEKYAVLITALLIIISTLIFYKRE